MTQHEKGGLPPDHYFLLKVNATVARHVITCLCAFVRTLATSIFFGPFCSTEMKQLRQRMREFTNLAFLAACFRDIRDICKDEQGCRCHKHVAFPMHFLHMFLLLVGGGLASLLHATSRLAQSFLLTICLVFNLFACGFALTFFLTAIPFQFHLGLGFIVFHCSPRAAPEQPQSSRGRDPEQAEGSPTEESLAEKKVSQRNVCRREEPPQVPHQEKPRREKSLAERKGSQRARASRRTKASAGCSTSFLAINKREPTYSTVSQRLIVAIKDLASSAVSFDVVVEHLPTGFVEQFLWITVMYCSAFSTMVVAVLVYSIVSYGILLRAWEVFANSAFAFRKCKRLQALFPSCRSRMPSPKRCFRDAMDVSIADCTSQLYFCVERLLCFVGRRCSKLWSILVMLMSLTKMFALNVPLLLATIECLIDERFPIRLLLAIMMFGLVWIWNRKAWKLHVGCVACRCLTAMTGAIVCWAASLPSMLAASIFLFPRSWLIFPPGIEGEHAFPMQTLPGPQDLTAALFGGFEGCQRNSAQNEFLATQGVHIKNGFLDDIPPPCSPRAHSCPRLSSTSFPQFCNESCESSASQANTDEPIDLRENEAGTQFEGASFTMECSTLGVSRTLLDCIRKHLLPNEYFNQAQRRVFVNTLRTLRVDNVFSQGWPAWRTLRAMINAFSPSAFPSLVLLDKHSRRLYHFCKDAWPQKLTPLGLLCALQGARPPATFVHVGGGQFFSFSVHLPGKDAWSHGSLNVFAHMHDFVLRSVDIESFDFEIVGLIDESPLPSIPGGHIEQVYGGLAMTPESNSASESAHAHAEHVTASSASTESVYTPGRVFGGATKKQAGRHEHRPGDGMGDRSTFINSGKTCYISAFLQAMFHCNGLLACIRTHTSPQLCEKKDCELCALAVIEEASREPGASLTTRLMKSVCKKAGLRWNEQQDVLDLLRHILTVILEGHASDKQRWLNHCAWDKTVTISFMQDCEGKCKRQSHETSANLAATLTVPPDSESCDLAQLFGELHDDEQIGDSKGVCEVCHTRVSRSTSTTWDLKGDICMMHLNRGLNAADLTHRKVQFDFDSFCGDSSYILKAVVLHLSNVASQGHYVCFTRSPTGWYLFDDTNVSSHSGLPENAYTHCVLLAYEKTATMMIDSGSDSDVFEVARPNPVKTDPGLEGQKGDRPTIPKASSKPSSATASGVIQAPAKKDINKAATHVQEPSDQKGNRPTNIPSEPPKPSPTPASGVPQSPGKPHRSDTFLGDFVDEAAILEGHVVELLDTFVRPGGNADACRQFLASLPMYTGIALTADLEASVFSFRAGLVSMLKPYIGSKQAVEITIPSQRCCVYPLVVLFEAMSRATSMPSAFYLDSFFALMSSLMHKEICADVSGFESRSRYWVVGTAEPGSGKSPAMNPLRDLLFKVLCDSEDLAPGVRSSRFHMQEGTTHWVALDRLKQASSYLLIASAEAGPMLCPSWPTSATWNQATHINYQRFLDAANGGPIPWETKNDRAKVGKDDDIDENAEATGGFERTNVVIVFFQQLKWFANWWARSEAAHHVGLASRFLFTFGMSSPPGYPQYRAFTEKVAFPIISNIFKAVLETLGPRVPMTEHNNLRCWKCHESMQNFVFNLRTLCHDFSKNANMGGITVDGLNKCSYWIAQVSLYSSILEQLLPPILQRNPAVALIPHLSSSSLILAADFFWRRYLFGLSVLDVDIGEQAWLNQTRQGKLKPLTSMNSLAARLLRGSTAHVLRMMHLRRLGHPFRHLVDGIGDEKEKATAKVLKLFDFLQLMGVGCIKVAPDELGGVVFWKMHYKAMCSATHTYIRRVKVPSFQFGVDISLPIVFSDSDSSSDNLDHGDSAEDVGIPTIRRPPPMQAKPITHPSERSRDSPNAPSSRQPTPAPTVQRPKRSRTLCDPLGGSMHHGYVASFSGKAHDVSMHHDHAASFSNTAQPPQKRKRTAEQEQMRQPAPAESPATSSATTKVEPKEYKRIKQAAKMDKRLTKVEIKKEEHRVKVERRSKSDREDTAVGISSSDSEASKEASGKGYRTIGAANILFKEHLDGLLPATATLTALFKQKIEKHCGFRCSLKFLGNRSAKRDVWQGKCSETRKCPAYFSVVLHLIQSAEYAAHDLVVYQHDEHSQKKSHAHVIGSRVLTTRQEQLAHAFLLEHKGEPNIVRRLRRHLVAKGYKAAELPFGKKMTNWVQREYRRQNKHCVPVGPAVASLEASVREWTQLSVSVDASPEKLLLVGDETLTSNRGYVPFSCKRFLNFAQKCEDAFVCAGTDVKMGMVTGGWGLAVLGFLMKHAISNTTIGRSATGPPVQMPCHVSTFVPFLFALLNSESEDNFTAFFNDADRLWAEYCPSMVRLRTRLRQLHKDFAAGIEAARRSVWRCSRPLNDYAHLIRNARMQLLAKLTQRAEVGGGRLMKYLDVCMRLLEYSRILPTLDLFSIIWESWMKLMVHVWREIEAFKYLDAMAKRYSPEEAKTLYNFPSRASSHGESVVLVFCTHWIGLAGTIPGTGSGNQCTEAWNRRWQSELAILGKNASPHAALGRMQYLFEMWLPELNLDAKTSIRVHDINPHLLYNPQLLKIGTSPTAHYWKNREGRNHVVMENVKDGAILAAAANANLALDEVVVRHALELLQLSGDALRERLLSCNVLQVDTPSTQIVLNTIKFQE